MVFDGHSDIWTDITIRHLKGEKDILKSHHMERLRDGDIEGSIFVMWIDPPYDKNPYKRSLDIFDAIKAEMESKDSFVVVHNYKEMMEAKKAGKFYIFIGIEGLSPIGDNVDRIDEYYDFGARHAMLTWNEQNPLATGVQGEPTRGLTKAGKAAVKKIQDNHMLMDVSHLNDTSFWDVMSLATGPIIASHSNARALSSAKRNLTDEQLLKIKETGGLVGINSFNLFVSQSIENQTIDNLVKHMVYICDKIGTDHVGFGFDFFEFLSTDSMSSYSDQDTSFTRGLESCTKVPYLVSLLEKEGFTNDELEAIKYKNWHNLIKKVIG